MLGAEIVLFVRKFRNLRRHFKGTFASDQVQARCKTLRNRSFLICNTSPSKGPGRHWFLLLKLENHFGESDVHLVENPSLSRAVLFPEVFDSLGTSREEVQSRLGTGVTKCFFNSSPVQPADSVLCGQFCLYFALVRLYNADQRFAKVIMSSSASRSALI